MKIGKELLKNLFPFLTLDEDKLSKICEYAGIEVKDYLQDEVIIDRSHGERALCFVVEGKCEVERSRGASDTMPVKTLGPFDSFGIISVFSQRDSYPTSVVAKAKTSILLIPKDTLLKILADYPEVSLRIIEFLSSKVEYLNDTVSTFCQKSTEGRLARKLILMRSRLGDKIEISMTRLCSEIGIGRASLYRILVEFEKNGLIKTDKKTIIILNPKGLEEIL